MAPDAGSDCDEWVFLGFMTILHLVVTGVG